MRFILQSLVQEQQKYIKQCKSCKETWIKDHCSDKQRRIGTGTISRLHHQGSRKNQRRSKTASIQLLSSLFDQSVHIVLDELCLKLSRRDDVSDEMAAGNHVNVE